MVLYAISMLFSNLYSNVTMRLLVHYALLLLVMECSALTCRSEHGPKNEELKKVFNNCIRQQQGQGSENRHQSSQNERGNRSNNQRNQWEGENRNDNRDEQTGDNKKSRDRSNDYRGNNNGREDRTNNGRWDNRAGNMNDMRKGNGGGRNGMTNSYGRADQLRGQDEFLQSEEYSDDSQNSYYASIKPPRRYKREKRVEMNSGQRSQYNPNSQRNNWNNENNHEVEKEERRNSSENNSSSEVDKACVLHCFVESLHMTDDSGMPDRYLVTHVLTKDEKNEDLRDFLQESIEECFQILDNENTEDKCEFSKNLLTCLSEKGRANCDEWNGKPSFLF